MALKKPNLAEHSTPPAQPGWFVLELTYHCLFTDSRTTVWDWMTPLETSSSIWDQLQHLTEGYIQVGFKYLQAWRCHNLSGNPVPVLSQLHIKKKKHFLHLNGISSILISSWCLLSCHLKSLNRFWLHLLYYSSTSHSEDAPELSPLQAEQPQLSPPLLVWKITAQHCLVLCSIAVPLCPEADFLKLHLTSILILQPYTPWLLGSMYKSIINPFS